MSIPACMDLVSNNRRVSRWKGFRLNLLNPKSAAKISLTLWASSRSLLFSSSFLLASSLLAASSAVWSRNGGQGASSPNYEAPLHSLVCTHTHTHIECSFGHTFLSKSDRFEKVSITPDPNLTGVLCFYAHSWTSTVKEGCNIDLGQSLANITSRQQLFSVHCIHTYTITKSSQMPDIISKGLLCIYAVKHKHTH